jgi:hypothetical protein
MNLSGNAGKSLIKNTAAALVAVPVVYFRTFPLGASMLAV